MTGSHEARGSSPLSSTKKQVVTCNFDGQLFGAGRQHFVPTHDRTTSPNAAGIDAYTIGKSSSLSRRRSSRGLVAVDWCKILSKAAN
jgi:hypothetical protein